MIEDLKGIVHSDPEIMSGTPVFVGTRVPLQNLIDYLEGGESIEDFLDGFPSVTRTQAIAVIEAGKHARGRAFSRSQREHCRLVKARAVQCQLRRSAMFRATPITSLQAPEGGMGLRGAYISPLRGLGGSGLGRAINMALLRS